ncbi:MAG: hypothetical protein ACOC53_06115, partial [Candidatus Saliniplasma sp.]
MSAEIECPVCESKIPSDSEKCPECGVDLSLFDVEVSEASIESEEDIEEIMGKLVDDEDDLELLKEIKGLNGEDLDGIESMEDVEDIIEDEAEEDEAEEEEEVLMFACPICDAEVSEDAKECPQCGAIFEEDEDEDEVVEEGSTADKTENVKSKELTDGIERIKGMLGDIRSAKIDNSAFKNKMDELVDTAKGGDYDEGLRLLKNLEEMGENILKIDDLLSDINFTLEDIPDGIDVSEQLEKLDMVMDLGESGDYSSALLKAEEIVDELEDIKENQMKILQDELDRKLKEARKALSEARDTKINIDDIKNLMSQAVKEKKSGDLQDAIEGFEDVKKWAYKVVDIYDSIIEGKKKIRELKDNGMEFKTYISDLKEAKSKADEGNYTGAEKKLEELLGQIHSDLEEGGVEEEEEKEETQEELKEKFRNRISSLKEKVSKAGDTDIDIKPLRTLVSEIKDSGMSGDFEKALRKMDEVDQLFNEIIETDEKITSIKNKIEDIEEQGFETARFEEDLEKAIVLADEGEYQEVLGMLEKVSKDISEYVERSEKEEEQRKEEIELEFKNQLSEARRKLSEARDFKLNIDPLKSIMRAAVKKGSEGEYEDGMEKIENIFEKFELLKPISEKIEEGKNLIRELRDNDLDYNKYIRELKKGKLKTDQGDYQESLSLINEVISDIKDDLEDAELDKDIPSPEEIELEVEEELKKAEGKEETEEEVESE